MQQNMSAMGLSVATVNLCYLHVITEEIYIATYKTLIVLID